MTINIFVTGTSRGIGAAIAARLRSEDCAIAATSSKDGDLNDPDTPSLLWNNALQELGGRIDVVINNAGVFEENPLTSDTWTVNWNRTMQINLTASAELCRLAVLHWQDTNASGRIINIASRAAPRTGGIARHIGIMLHQRAAWSP